MKISLNFFSKKILFILSLITLVTFNCSLPKRGNKNDITENKIVSFPNYQKLFENGSSIEKIDLLVEKAIKGNKELKNSAEGGQLSAYRRWRSFWVGRQTTGSSKRANPQKYLTTLVEFSDHEICKESGDWNLIGPNKAPLKNGVELHTMGAVFAVAADPNNLNIVYAGTGSGGIWKTTSALSLTPQWDNITDHLNLPTLGITDIAMNPHNSKTLYAATSEMRAGYGFGIIKSIDAGVTWNTTALEFVPTDLERLDRILINPLDTNTIFSHSETEVYLTTDGGITWPSIPTPFNGFGNIRSMEFNLSDYNIVYIGSDKLFKFDKNSNTTSQLDLLSSFEIPNSNNPDFFYNSFEAELSSAEDGCYSLIKWKYVSLDPDDDPIYRYEIKKYSESNNNWESVSFVNSFAQIFIVNPSNTDIMYFGDANGRVIKKSVNGGETSYLPPITNYWADNPYYGVSTHADIRTLKLLSSSNDGLSDILLVGSDGGILMSQSAQTTSPINLKVDWKDLNGEGLAITEYYGLGSSETNPHLIHGGTQDNGFMTYNSSLWNNYIKGDAYDCVIDQTNPSIGYGQMNYPSLRKTSNFGQTWSSFDNQPLWNQNCQDPSNSCFPAWWKITKWPLLYDSDETLYLGHFDLYKYSSGVSTLPNQISDFASFGIPVGQNLIAVDVSKSNPEIIYAGFPNPNWSSIANKLYKFDGSIWIDRTPVGAKYHGITDIVTSPDNPEKVWVTFDQLDGSDRVNYSPDGGLTWQDWSNGLPPFPVNCIVYQEGSNDLLYVGTDVGVYYREGGSSNTTWECFNKNLPTTLVSDLEINYCSQKIRAATFGRGLWESPLVHTNSISIVDTDGDGICDTGDQCPGFNDNIIGTPCDDGDNCTINDIYNSNCNCVGTPFNTFNLIIKDNPTDIGNQPNMGDLWNGNIWNCNNDQNLNCNSMENPEYKTLGMNRLRVRVDNIGCISSLEGEAKLHIYWTIGRAEELWMEHWFDPSIEPTNIIDGASGGGEITPPSGVPIPSIPAGESIVLNHDWMPPNPANFNSITGDPMICFLARIESDIDPIEGESIGPIAGNVRNSNNIATINTTLVDLDPMNKIFPTYSFYLNNPYGRQVSLNLLIEDLNKRNHGFFEKGSLEVGLDKVDKKRKKYKPIKLRINSLRDLDKLKNIVLNPNEILQASFKFIHSDQDIKGSNFKLKIKSDYILKKAINTEFIFDIKVKSK